MINDIGSKKYHENELDPKLWDGGSTYIHACIYICVYACIYVCIYMRVCICMCMRSGSRSFLPSGKAEISGGVGRAPLGFGAHSLPPFISPAHALLPLSPLLLPLSLLLLPLSPLLLPLFSPSLSPCFSVLFLAPSHCFLAH